MAPAQAPLPRRAFLKGAAATAGAVTLGGPILLARPAIADIAIEGIHLSYGELAGRQAGVSWFTTSAASPVLDFGTSEAYGTTLSPTTLVSPDWETTRHHHVPLTRLDPDTTYHYRIRPDASASSGRTGTFRTAPMNPKSFRFVMFGDMGVGVDPAAVFSRVLEARPAFCFVPGDLCYADLSGGLDALAGLPYTPQTWDAWLRQIEPSASAVPWMSTVGNHEMERTTEKNKGADHGYANYLAKFQLPRNGVLRSDRDTTYHFRYGNVAFIAADGNDVSYEIKRNHGYLGGQQETWLRNTLRMYREDKTIDFIVVGFHNCMYCTNAFHGSDGGNRRWEPIFDEFSVDVVVNGHNHSYERTHPVRGGVPVTAAPPNSLAAIDSSMGTTYITAGGGGQKEYPTHTAPEGYVVDENGARVPEAAPWSAVTHPGHSIAVVDVFEDAQRVPNMKITGIAKDQTVIDTITLKRPAALTSQ